MLPSKMLGCFTAILCLAIVVYPVLIHPEKHVHLYGAGISMENADGIRSSQRLLQVVPAAGNTAPSLNDQIIANCNSLRAKKGLPELKMNSKFQQVLKQWATSLKNKMSLTQYLAIYGNHYFQVYLFSAIPT